MIIKRVTVTNFKIKKDRKIKVRAYSRITDFNEKTIFITVKIPYIARCGVKSKCRYKFMKRCYLPLFNNTVNDKRTCVINEKLLHNETKN